MLIDSPAALSGLSGKRGWLYWLALQRAGLRKRFIAWSNGLPALALAVKVMARAEATSLSDESEIQARRRAFSLSFVGRRSAAIVWRWLLIPKEEIGAAGIPRCSTLFLRSCSWEEWCFAGRWKLLFLAVTDSELGPWWYGFSFRMIEYSWQLNFLYYWITGLGGASLATVARRVPLPPGSETPTFAYETPRDRKSYGLTLAPVGLLASEPEG